MVCFIAHLLKCGDEGDDGDGEDDDHHHYNGDGESDDSYKNLSFNCFLQAQYRFCFKAILDFLDSFDDYANFQDLTNN